MFKKNQYDEYEAVINGLTFVCEEEPSKEDEETAEKIASVYKSKLKEIAEFLLDCDIEEFFGEMSEEELISSLGMPTVDIESQTVSYTEHELDDMHIISFEYEGILDEFMDLCIDG